MTFQANETKRDGLTLNQNVRSMFKLMSGKKKALQTVAYSFSAV